jgi:hypothetical protein
MITFAVNRKILLRAKVFFAGTGAETGTTTFASLEGGDIFY